MSEMKYHNIFVLKLFFVYWRNGDKYHCSNPRVNLILIFCLWGKRFSIKAAITKNGLHLLRIFLAAKDGKNWVKMPAFVERGAKSIHLRQVCVSTSSSSSVNNVVHLRSMRGKNTSS